MSRIIKMSQPDTKIADYFGEAILKIDDGYRIHLPSEYVKTIREKSTASDEATLYLVKDRAHNRLLAFHAEHFIGKFKDLDEKSKEQIAPDFFERSLKKGPRINISPIFAKAVIDNPDNENQVAIVGKNTFFEIWHYADWKAQREQKNPETQSFVATLTR